MVRFSDIIKTKGKKDEGKKSSDAARHEDGFRLSDSRLFKARDVDSPVNKEPGVRRAGSIETVNYYRAFVERTRETGQAVKNDMNISPASILSDLHSIIEKGLIDGLYEYAVSVKNHSYDIALHTVAVAFTSLKLGRAMKYDIKMMMRLGLAAFLENTGMYKIPENIITATGKLSAEERALIRKHPETGRDILSNLGERYLWLADAALSTHERYDGSGYPAGLRGDEIPEISAVIGLVDTYIAMINIRPYRDKIIQTEAIKYITGEGRGRFSPGIVKVFLDQVSMFPVNSHVKLNNGSIAKVLATDRRHPLSPVVEIICDGEGHETDRGQLINIADNPLLYIKRAINPDDPAD